MHNRILLMISCSIVMQLSACALNPQHKTLEEQMIESQRQGPKAKETREYLEEELSQAERRLQLLAVKLKNSEDARNKQARDLKNLQLQYDYLKNINLQQSENIKTLKLELTKKKSVIEIQEKVIQLLDDTKKTIETSLKDQIAAQQVEVIEAQNKLKVIFVDKILFDSGSSKIKSGGKELLLAMARSLSEDKNHKIVIEGHTDDVPLTASLKKRFLSNWELSTARASAVADFFEKEGGILPQKLTASGFSYHRPVATNDTLEGRRQNRRIEIILEPVE